MPLVEYDRAAARYDAGRGLAHALRAEPAELLAPLELTLLTFRRSPSPA